MDTITALDAERTKKIEQFIDLVKEEKLDPFDPEEMESEITDHVEFELALVREKLNKCPNHLINSLYEEIMHGDPDFSSDLITLIGAGNNSLADVHEFLVFRPHLNPDTGFGTILSILRPLHLYTQLPEVENYAETSAEVQAQIIALLKVTEAIEGRGINDRSSVTPINFIQGMTMLSGDDLIRLVLNRPSDADHIARIIIDRNTQDPAFITMILDSGAVSLSSGAI